MPNDKAAKAVPDRVKEILGVQVGQDAAIIQDKPLRIKCPQCGDQRLSVQAEETICLGCGTAEETANFVDAHVVYVKVIPESEVRLSRKDIRYKVMCPSCGSRDLDFILSAARARCNQCFHEGEVLSFYRSKGHEHPIPAGAEADGDV